jgi:hypothetical protein
MIASRFLTVGILAALPSLAMAQVPPIQAPPGMAADASNAVLPNALSNLGALPHVASNASLSAKGKVSAPQGVYRDHYAAGGLADGPTLFQPETGTCAANSWVNDGGNCVDSTSGDGNSWLALHRNNTLNVREFGARGNNSTDDSAAIQAAVAAAQATTLGLFQDYVVFPSGTYCVSSLTSTTAARLALIGYGNAIVKVCGAHDVGVFALNGNNEAIRDLQIQGYNSPTATQAALALGSSCVECFVGERVFVQYGLHAITNAAPDAKIWAKAIDAYGSSLALGTAGAFWLRNKFDQPYPTNTAPAVPYTLAAWTGSHVYAANDLVTIGSNAWVLQATVGGTSGSGSEPAVAAYGSNITDGSVTWQLAAPRVYYALQLQTGASPTFVDKLDCTGVFARCVELDNGNGGNGPQQVTLRDINAGQNLDGGVWAQEGQNLTIDGGSATNCVLAGCVGVALRSTWGQNAHIGGGFMAYANPYDIYLSGGTGTIIDGASLHGSSSACVNVAANVNDFAILGTDFSTGAIWGTCTVAVNIASGTSDYYKAIGNIMHGATTGITDGGSGAHKTLLGND